MGTENIKSIEPAEDFVKLKIFCQRHQDVVSEAQIRWLIFTGRADYFIRRLGARRLLVSPKRFFEWIEKNGEVKHV
jgi:hypothetical protein